MSSASVESPYRDLPDGSIRVILLKPGPPEAPLQAELHSVRLEIGTAASHSYEAISYCWGDAGFTRKLDLLGQGTLPLTESLFLALHSLRHTERPRTLWADAVCINQSDLEERSAQVAVMGDIFAQADRVLVWLGPISVNNTEPLAFATLAVPLEAKSGRSRDELLRLVDTHLSRMTHCACCGHSLGTGVPVRLADGLAAVARLLERPWFERLWVVQEVALAKHVEVYCGSHHAPWYNFIEIARVPGQDEDHMETRSTNVMPRSKLREIWARCNYLNQLRARNRTNSYATSPFRPTELCNDLLMLSYLQCREPHDRIFGVSKVLGLQGFKNLKADYSLPVAELYRRTVELFLTAAANRPGGYASMMLALVGTELAEVPNTPGLPSWVPNLQYLSERSRAKHTYFQWIFAENRYLADVTNFRCKISASNPNELMVRGRCYGTIKAVMSDSCPSKHVHRRIASKCPDEEAMDLIHWYRRCRVFLSDYKPLQSLASLNSDGRAEFGDIISYPSNVQRAIGMPSVPVALMESWLAKFDDKQSDLPDAGILAHHLRPYITGHPCDRERNLGVIDCEFGTFHAAWLPSTAQPGDKVCHFAGAPEPFILQPHGAGHFELKGDAYIHGQLHHLLLEVDQRLWETLLSDLKIADDHLKVWTESKNRNLLRTNSDDMETMRKLSLTYHDVKETRQRLVEQIRAVHRDADERFGWIRLR